MYYITCTRYAYIGVKTKESVVWWLIYTPISKYYNIIAYVHNGNATCAIEGGNPLTFLRGPDH